MIGDATAKPSLRSPTRGESSFRRRRRLGIWRGWGDLGGARARGALGRARRTGPWKGEQKRTQEKARDRPHWAQGFAEAGSVLYMLFKGKG